MSDYVTVYDQDGQMLCVLDNAMDVGYTLKHNDLSTATFSLPADDPRNIYCQAHNLVSLPEHTRDIGLFRIISMPSADEITQGGVKVYSLEHVMATLVDDLLFGYHEIGGTEIYTDDIMRYILARQTVPRWQLGVCEFSDQYMYKFENDSLLSSLLSLGQVLLDDYTWEFDTSRRPWTINLRHTDGEPGCGIHYMRNLTGIDKSWDATTLVTRLYLLGYGEGINQLNVTDINDGKPYIDADTIDTWGIKCAPFVDTRLEDPHTLLARGRAVLEGLKDPYFSYTATAIDLARLTGYAWDTFMPGKLVRVEDSEHGVNLTARIVSIEKPDLRGRPGDITITIANAARDVSDSINTLADRMGINELYSQGATNLYAQQFVDNADASHPAVMRVYVPSGCVRINKMQLSWRLSAFRAYETGAAAGGSTTTSSNSGGGGVTTSESSGGGTVTSDASSKSTVSISSVLSGYSTIGNTDLNTYPVSTGSTSGTSGASSDSTGTNSTAYTSYNAHVEGSTHRHTLGDHTHSMNSHTHSMPSHSHSISTHSHYYGDHRHLMDHSHDISHTHSVSTSAHSHSVSITAHTHTTTLSNHTHQIQYGIYEGGRASGISIVVDGNEVPEESVSASEMDIAAWLAKDDDGKIRRGTWHTVQLVPDGLTRIEANLFVQTFVQSVGGGNY